ncbi:MAG: DUF2071 domain-containing protein [Planctomycetota bacterium]
MSLSDIQFGEDQFHRPRVSGIDVITTLQHFAIITYVVDPDALRPHVHERFELDCIRREDGSPGALISVVPFLDLDFRFIRFPWFTWKFGQTNYRAYVRDRQTGEHVAWFFGTSLDSWTVNIPKHIWKLPWHRGKIRFETSYDRSKNRYSCYEMETESSWAPASLKLEDTGVALDSLDGFATLESGLVILTHPLKGYYHRRDGRLGSYSIWHDKLQMTIGNATRAEFPLLERLGLVRTGDTSNLHSVMIQPATEFTIYLPPRPVS